MPAYLDTGLNWVHVKDVAIGHILAARDGKIGERYILGHADGNWTMKQAFEVLEEVSGVPAPKMRIPYAVALAAAYLNEAVFVHHPQAPAGSTGRGAHGEVQDVLQPGEGHPRIEAAADPAPAGTG